MINRVIDRKSEYTKRNSRTSLANNAIGATADENSDHDDDVASKNISRLNTGKRIERGKFSHQFFVS